MRTFIVGVAFLWFQYFEIPAPLFSIILILLVGGVFSFLQDLKELVRCD